MLILQDMEPATKFLCEYCRKEFVRPSSLAVHICEPKRRRQEQHERGVQLGFRAFLKFYEVSQGSSRLKTFDDFAESPYYRAFVKFGRYCVNTHAIDPEMFLDWLLKTSKKIDQWATDQNYTLYLVDYLLRREKADAALRRAIEWSLDWEERQKSPAHDCLRFGNTNAICHAITAGKISAWIIYNCESGRSLLENLSSEQISIIWPYIDSDVWQHIFANYPADREFVSQTLTDLGW